MKGSKKVKMSAMPKDELGRSAHLQYVGLEPVGG